MEIQLSIALGIYYYLDMIGRSGGEGLVARLTSTQRLHHL